MISIRNLTVNNDGKFHLFRRGSYSFANRVGTGGSVIMLQINLEWYELRNIVTMVDFSLN